MGGGSCPNDNWIKVEENCYLFGETAMNYNDAKQYCQARDSSKLLEVTSQKIQNQVEDLVESIAQAEKSFWKTLYWLGGIKQNGSWKWESSSIQITYTNLGNGQPDNFRSNENCINLLPKRPWNAKGKWNDIACEKTQETS